MSALACEWTLRDPSPLFLPLQPRREHSRVRLICIMILLCITVYSITDHYARVWHRIICYTFSVIACWKVGHCLRVDLTLGFILFSFRLVCFGGSLWYGWVRKGGRGIADFGICYVRLLATLCSQRAVVRHTFGSLPNRPCLEEVNTSRPKGCFEHMIDWQYFSLGYQEQDAFFAKS